MLLHEAFEATASRVPAKTALVCGDERVSYGELQRRVHALAAQLQAAGVAPGDRVVLLLEGDVSYAIAVHAVLCAGAVFVPLTATTKPDKLAFVLNDTEATTLLADARLRGTWADLPVRCPALRRVIATDGFAADGERPPAPRIDQDLAAIIYTSGSTGTPKGVMLTHLNMLSAWRSVQAYLGLRTDDVIGLALPPTFSYGLYHLLMGLGLGATVVLERQAAFPLRLAQGLQRERATVIPGVPTLLASLLDLPQRATIDLSALRLVTNAAAALPTPLVPRLLEALPRADLLLMYGMTECKRISYLPAEEAARRPGSVGRGMPNQQHWLADELSRPLPHGSTGELVVRGAHVMRGYWRRPQETAQRLRPSPIHGENVLHTGDLFRTDAEGWLHFVSRLDDIIKTRGEKVAPREVEEAIHRLPGVAACAVIGVPDDALGQAVKAYVVRRPGSELTVREVTRHCLGHLENYMAPKQVEFVDTLPTTESGKIRHATLRGG